MWKGQRYYHFKNPNIIYTVIGLALDMNNNSKIRVVYINEHTKELFIRDEKEFKDILQFDDGETINRFTNIAYPD